MFKIGCQLEMNHATIEGIWAKNAQLLPSDGKERQTMFDLNLFISQLIFWIGSRP